MLGDRPPGQEQERFDVGQTSLMSRLSVQSRAVTLMLAAVVGYSVLPLLVDVSDGVGSVALLTGVWAFTHSAVNAAAVRRWSRQAGLRVRGSGLARRIPWWAYTAAFVAAFQWVFFAWSSRLTETAVTTLIFEFWPVLFLVGRRLLPSPGHKRPVAGGDLVLVAAAAVGLSLVIFSNSGTSAGSTSWAGAVFAGTALMIAAGERVAHLRSGELVAESLQTSRSENTAAETEPEAAASARTRTLIGAFQNVAARGTASVLLLIVGAVQHPGSGEPLAVTIAVGFGLGAVHAVSGLTFSYANHLSDTDTINSLYFAVPTLALVWLWTFTDVTVSHPALFVAGGIGVLAVNMVIHLDPEGTGRRTAASGTHQTDHGFKALILSLWASGTFVTLRDDMLPRGMLRWQAGDYWAMLTLVATVFVFVLSFRQSRAAERDREADLHALKALAEIDTLRDIRQISPETADVLAGSLNRIDTETGIADIRDGYRQFRRTVLHTDLDDDADTDTGSVVARRRTLLHVETLANLRRRGRETTELAVLALFAALVCFAALLFRPARSDSPLSPWEGFGTEMISMNVAAAVVFLVFDLADRHRLRDSPTLRRTPKPDGGPDDEHQPAGWQLNLHVPADHTKKRAAQTVTVTLGAAIIAVFAALLRHKWITDLATG